MQECLVVGFGFERMANGVAEVQDAPQPALTFILGDDFSLNAHAFCDEPFQRSGIALQDALAILFHVAEDFSIANHSAFQRLEQSGAEFAIR